MTNDSQKMLGIDSGWGTCETINYSFLFSLSLVVSISCQPKV